MSTTIDGTEAGATTTSCWRALKLLADRVRTCPRPVSSCWLLIADEPQVAVNPAIISAGEGWLVSVIVDPSAYDELPLPLPAESRYVLEDLILLQPIVTGVLPTEAAAMLELYLPYCLAPVHARRTGRAFTVSHFAQSLDGRIATSGGDARWIGCDANRVHAHRMRALCDGILIGAQTLRTDRPALTVRHAEGADPIRIVVGDADDLACLEQAGPGAILVIGNAASLAPRRSSTSLSRGRTDGSRRRRSSRRSTATTSSRSTSKAAPRPRRASSPRGTSTSSNSTSRR